MVVSIGQTVGDYRVIDILGAGGMGTVYKVQHMISERVEAMKVVLPNLADNPDQADRFIREIKIQARLSHPNIAALHNALRYEDQLLMVMEYVDGDSLYTRLRRGSLSPAASIGIANQVLGALAFAHAQGVIHRDVKPANIMLTDSGAVKLMDFGIARSKSDLNLTRAGTAVGSVYYMSPEQVRSAPVDARSDLYSAGIVLYEMATGVRPIDGATSFEVMQAHISRLPRPPVALNGSVPEALSLAILKAVEKNPDNRFQSATEFSDVLQSIRRRFSFPQGSEDMPPLPALLNETEVAMPATPAPGSGSAGAAINGARFEAEGLEKLTRDLAVYVGPMARILVNQAAKKAGNWKQLNEAVAAEIPEGPERKAFLAGRPLR